MARTAKSIGRKVFESSVHGYGFSLGSDAWKATKPSETTVFLLIVFFGMFAIPFYAGKILSRSRSFLGFLLRMLPSAIVFAFGYCLLYFGVRVLVGLPWLAMFKSEFFANNAFWVTNLVAAICVLAGAVIGLGDAAEQDQEETVQRHNDEFLNKLGFKETGGKDITHFDADGLPLRLIETHADRLVFMIVGKRGQRAFIERDLDGRMRSYSHSDSAAPIQLSSAGAAQ